MATQPKLEFTSGKNREFGDQAQADLDHSDPAQLSPDAPPALRAAVRSISALSMQASNLIELSLTISTPVRPLAQAAEIANISSAIVGVQSLRRGREQRRYFRP